MLTPLLIWLTLFPQSRYGYFSYISFIIFYNAKIIERKNPELLIKSFIQIREACDKKITLIIAGDGNIKDVLIKKYRNYREIKFVGFINQNLLVKYVNELISNRISIVKKLKISKKGIIILPIYNRTKILIFNKNGKKK